jgi:WD40 repeat protein
LFKNGAFGPNNQQTKFNCVAFDDDGVCYSGGANGAVHCWDQRGELALVLKAHSGECTAVAGNQNTLVSFGKDFKVCIHTYNKGTYEFAKQIDVETRFIASGIDYLDGSIIIGHDNGVIASVDVDSEAQ